MKPPPFGVYLSPTGKLKVFYETETHWILDEGKIVKHPVFRFRTYVVKEMSKGWPVLTWRGDLKDCEYLGEL